MLEWVRWHNSDLGEYLYPCFAVPSLVSKWQKVHDGVKDSLDAYETICKSVTPANKEAWIAEEEKARRERINNVHAMDIYDVETTKGLLIVIHTSVAFH